jgi:hypothetical protein
VADTVTLAEPTGPPTEATPEPRRLTGQVLATLPWLIVLALLLAAWWRADVPTGDITRYTAYWLLGLLLSGTLVHRALRGGRGNLAEDLGYGAATGLLLELAAWAISAAGGLQHLLRWWPVPVVLLFLLVPGLRRHWRVGERRPLPLGWHWAMAGVLVLIVGWTAVQWPDTPLPPVNAAYYQDLLYHLSLVQELTRTIPFELPHAVNEPLRYHYLSDAHMASASMMTGVPPAVVLLRLWLVPVAAAAAMVTAGLTRDLAQRWWAGPVVAAVTYLGLPVALGSAMADGSAALSVGSTSQTYVLPLFILLVGLCVEVVRGRSLGRGWVLVPALGLACAGAKSSALPPLIAGLLLAGLVAGVRRRRVPWPTVAALLVLVAAMAVGFRLFAGGGAGTLRVQVLALLRFMGPYRETLGAEDGIQPGGLVPPGLAAAGTDGWVFAVGILAWWLLMQAPRFVGMLLPFSRGRRLDPAAWLLSGIVLAGVGATWVFHHPSASQVYFYLAVLPFGAVLSGWLLAEARLPWQVPVAAGVAGVIVTLAVPAMAVPAATVDGWSRTLVLSAARMAAFLVVAAVLGVLLAALLRRRSDGGAEGGRRWAAVAVAAATAALFGASVGAFVERTVEYGLDGRYQALILDRQLPPSANSYLVTRDEMRAALWLDANAADDDVVATNVHCRPVRTTPHCDARAFWVTGLGGHRAVVESWGYTDEAVAAHGRDGFGYVRQGPPDPELFALNERVFTAPTAADLDRLRREYGVRWLLADTRAGKVSPALAGLAEVRMVAGPVTIYRLR